MSQIRNFVFTLNNYTEEEYILLKSFDNQFLIIGKEIGENGTPHLQGYCELKSAKRLTTIKKIGGFERAHIESRRGTQKQAIEYCKKDGDWEEMGEPKNQGERKDLNEIKERIMNGEKVDDIAIEDPMVYHQYGRTLNKIEEIALRKKWRTWMTTCDWLYGPTGVGKSHRAFEGYNPETHYILNLQDNGWWDGYVGQEVIIINEFRGQIRYGKLLDLIDKYPKTVKQRNKAPVPFLAKHVIITSSMKPEDIYHGIIDINDNIEQLLRRVTVTEVVGGNTDPDLCNKNSKKISD